MRWTSSLRSWLGVTVAVLVGLPRVGAVLTGDAWWFDAVVIAATVVLGIQSAFRHVVVGDEGIAVRPGILRAPWSQIERFEARTAISSAVYVVLHGHRWRRALTTFGVSSERARALVERLDEELSTSRSG